MIDNAAGANANLRKIEGIVSSPPREILSRKFLITEKSSRNVATVFSFLRAENSTGLRILFHFSLFLYLLLLITFISFTVHRSLYRSIINFVWISYLFLVIFEGRLRWLVVQKFSAEVKIVVYNGRGNFLNTRTKVSMKKKRYCF